MISTSNQCGSLSTRIGDRVLASGSKSAKTAVDLDPGVYHASYARRAGSGFFRSPATVGSDHALKRALVSRCVAVFGETMRERMTSGMARCNQSLDLLQQRRLRKKRSKGYVGSASIKAMHCIEIAAGSPMVMVRTLFAQAKCAGRIGFYG